MELAGPHGFDDPMGFSISLNLIHDETFHCHIHCVGMHPSGSMREVTLKCSHDHHYVYVEFLKATWM